MTIWNLGSINIDHIYRLDHLPRPGETLAAQGYTVGLGGKGANQSIAASRAGADVRHIGAVGKGDDWVTEQMEEVGIDTISIARLNDQVTGHAIILLDESAENSIVLHAGANRAITLDTAAVDQMQAGDHLLIQNETNLQVELAELARSKDVQIIYSAAPFNVEALRAVLPHATILAMNAGEAAQMEAELGTLPDVQGLLITRGAEGAEYRDLVTGTTYQCASFNVEAVDTTGAGDCFAGYFTAARDLGIGIDQALRRASAAAAIQVTRHGASGAMPSAAEVDDFLSTRA